MPRVTQEGGLDGMSDVCSLRLVDDLRLCFEDGVDGTMVGCVDGRVRVPELLERASFVQNSIGPLPNQARQMRFMLL